MRIENPGPQSTAHEIELFERKCGARLPDAYRQFLLKFNGGQPEPDVVDVPGLDGTPTDVQLFFGIGRALGVIGLDWNLESLKERDQQLPLLPIACDSGGNLLCFVLERGEATSVVYFDWLDPAGATYDVAESFEGFVAKLRPLEARDSTSNQRDT